uniref:Calponin n=1 Tax=Sinocyclocheilus anshuiensis TaxID=1608454 RepID=A0A671L8F4_9TELE
MSTQFSKGPTFGLSADVRTKLAQKYDSQMEEALRMWIHEVTGRTVPDNFMEGLKDGVILCELINKLQPGSIPKVNYSALNWHKAKTKGFYTKSDIGVKYAAKKQRKFNPDKMKAWNSIISQQMGSNKFASQKGMTSYGTRRRLYNPNIGMEKHKPPNGQVTEKNVNLDPVDTTTVSLQMGTNKVPSQSGLTPMGGSRLVYDHKYCAKPNEQHGPDFGIITISMVWHGTVMELYGDFDISKYYIDYIGPWHPGSSKNTVELP